MTNSRRQRLTKLDWIKAGFRALVRHGAGWRLDDLTQDLQVSKGSFYWHFDDVADLRLQMLSAWQGLATTDLSHFVTQNAAPGERLRLLVQMVSVLPPVDLGGVGIEPALREWARIDPQAASTIAQVDRQRLNDLALWFGQSGMTPAAAQTAAIGLYAQIVGLMTLRISHPINMVAQLHALLDQMLMPRTAQDQRDSASGFPPPDR